MYRNAHIVRADGRRIDLLDRECIEHSECVCDHGSHNGAVSDCANA